MSLGWITESALLPKQSKKITVEGNSLVDLNAKILEEKSKILKKKEGGEMFKKKRDKKKGEIFKETKNVGIEDRMKKDEIENN